MLTIKRGKDKRVVHALLINVMDLPDGITMDTTELVPGTRLMEGSVIGVGADGKGHLIKTAVAYEQASNSATAYKVKKGSHFKVGDYLALGKGRVSKEITAVDRDSSALYDTITVSATLGAAVAAGDVLEAASNAASSAAYKYQPKAMLAESYEVEANTNLFVAAVTCGQFKEALVPPVTAALKGELKLIDFV